MDGNILYHSGGYFSDEKTLPCFKVITYIEGERKVYKIDYYDGISENEIDIHIDKNEDYQFILNDLMNTFHSAMEKFKKDSKEYYNLTLMKEQIGMVMELV